MYNDQLPPQREERSSSKDGDLGVAIAILIWGLLFLALPKWVDMSWYWPAIFYAWGFVLLLVSILGLCVELIDKRRILDR